MGIKVCLGESRWFPPRVPFEMARNIPIFPVEGAEGGESREAQEQLCLRSGMGCQPGDTSEQRPKWEMRSGGKSGWTSKAMFIT